MAVAQRFARVRSGARVAARARVAPLRLRAPCCECWKQTRDRAHAQLCVARKVTCSAFVLRRGRGANGELGGTVHSSARQVARRGVPAPAPPPRRAASMEHEAPWDRRVAFVCEPRTSLLCSRREARGRRVARRAVPPRPPVRPGRTPKPRSAPRRRCRRPTTRRPLAARPRRWGGGVGEEDNRVMCLDVPAPRSIREASQRARHN